MTNAGLQAMIAAYGDRIHLIVLDNNMKIWFNYPGKPFTVKDLKFVTYAGTDMFILNTPSLRDWEIEMGVASDMHYPTAMIQAVGVMSEAAYNAGNIRLDPMQIG